MSAQVVCPICKTKYTVADDLVGRTIPCKKCQESFVARPVADDVPAVEDVADVAKPPDVPPASPPDVKPATPPKTDVSPVPLAPDTPLVAAIKPPALAGREEAVYLPSPAGDLCPAAAGRYLVLTLPRSKQLA